MPLQIQFAYFPHPLTTMISVPVVLDKKCLQIHFHANDAKLFSRALKAKLSVDLFCYRKRLNLVFTQCSLLSFLSSENPTRCYHFNLTDLLAVMEVQSTRDTLNQRTVRNLSETEGGEKVPPVWNWMCGQSLLCPLALIVSHSLPDKDRHFLSEHIQGSKI